MKTGVISMNSDEDEIPPLDLARLVEDSGIESLFLPDHSHVPVGTGVSGALKVQYGGEEDAREQRFAASHGGLPREYYHNYEQLTTIAAMGAVTSTLHLGTAICLVVQRDPFYLAKQVASLDRFTGGRFIFGVGAGAPQYSAELQDHGVDLKTRNSLMLERIEAMKQIWTEDQAEYHGKIVDFGPTFSWPKPVTSPHPPILMGGMGPTVLDRTLSHADGWMPGHTDDTFPEMGDRVAELRERAASAGRSIEVSINLARPTHVEQYVAMGIDRVIYQIPSGLSAAETQQFVGELAKIAEQVR